jgi:tetratricopeptide (TPR) repeat protein
LLVLGATVSIWQAVRARRAERVANLERDRASSEAASAKAVTDFLQNSLLSQASAYRQDAEPDPDIRVRTLLDRAAAGIGDQFHGKPAIEADIRGTIGATYHDLGLLPQAAEQYRRQYDLDLRARGPRAPETYEALSNLATSRSDAGKLAEATRMREQALAGLLQSLGPHDSRTVAAMRSLGDDYVRQGEFAKAEPLLTKALADQTRALGPDNIATLDTVDSLEELYIDEDSSAQAEKLAADTLDASRRRYGPDHPLTIRASFRLGGIYERIGKYAQSEAVLTAALKGSTRLFGPEHPDTLGIMDMLAQALEDQGKYAEALAMQLKLYETDRRLGPDLPDTITEEAALATMYVHAGDAAKGERFYKDSLERATRVLGPSHPRTLITLSDLAYYYETHHRYAEAIPLEMRGVAASRTTSDFDRIQAVGFVSTLGRDYLAVGQYQLAEQRLREALARVMGISPDGWKRYYLESLIGAALIGEKKYAEAEPLVLSGYNGLKKQESSLRDYALPFVKEDGERVVSLYQAWGRPGEAAEWRRKLGEPTAPSRP